MLTIFRCFCHDETGTTHETLAATAAAVTFVCLLGAHFLAQISQAGGLPRIAIIAPTAQQRRSAKPSLTPCPAPAKRQALPASRFGDIDYSTTGSLSKDSARPIVLDPCTGRTR